MTMAAESYFDGLMQERLNSIANTLELHLSCTNPLISRSIWQQSNLEMSSGGVLTHWGPVKPYDDRDVGRHCLR